MKITPLALAGTAFFAGCSREDPATRAFRESMTEALFRSNHLVIEERAYIPDGGSILFTLRTNLGKTFQIQAMHHDPGMGGNPDYQEFHISSSREKQSFELESDSSLERRIVDLLSRCGFRESPDVEGGTPKPVPATRDWLLSRIRDRSIRKSGLSHCP